MNQINKNPISVFINENGVIEIDDGSPRLSQEEYELKRRERKRRGARLGHIKRRLKCDEPLTGELLELALNCTGHPDIAEKLKAGEILSDYEYHIFVEVELLHVRLGARSI